MDDEDVTDDQLIAGTWLIRFGSMSKTENKLMQERALSAEDAEDVAAEAALRLIASSPRELRMSFELVCSWHRWNFAYEMADKKQNVAMMMEAQKNMDMLLRAVH